MREVMMKAQELAEAILNSDIYQKMKTQEASVRHDPAAAAALGDMIEKGSVWNQSCLQPIWTQTSWRKQAAKWRKRKSG